MYGQEKRRGPRNTSLMLDILHIVIGILIVVLAVLAFLNPEGNRFLFPVIFLLACILHGVNGWYKILESGRDIKKKAAGWGRIGIALLLLAICILSAISLWR